MSKTISLLLCLSLVTGSISNCTDLSPASLCAADFKLSFADILYSLFHKDEICKWQLCGNPSSDTWSSTDSYAVEDTAVLTKKSGEDFVILNLTDVHFSDYGVRVLMSQRAKLTICRLVRKINPDLITVTGDFVCSESTVRSIKVFTSLMDSFKIPWAPLFGNHDGEGNCDMNFLADVMLKSKYCIFKKGAAELGVGNYIINIAEESDDTKDIIHSLILMDTHKTHLWQNQIEWYKWAAKGVSDAVGHEVESSVMFHIPCAEYQYAYDEAWDIERNCWRDGFDASGELNEKICCHRDENGQPINNGFFKAVKDIGTTKNIICGHEHINNFSILYQGVRLTYTLKVGKGSGYKQGFNGGTVIKINESGLTLSHIYSI